ncbi:MAG: GTPase Era [Bacteroidetes bacterium]|nr:MAG: GTPase Era [Bacteroidota bacterium]
MSHKAGFVNIIGSPNVGKSTLMNALVGEKISIITSKAQTTRDRILGIVNGDDFQIIYSDTPGIIKPAYELHERMMKSVSSAFSDADIILFMTDVFEKEENVESVVEKLQNATAPVLILLNKIDLIDEDKLVVLADRWSKKVKNAMVLPLSALKNFNVDTVFNYILKTLPESPAYYPKDQLTDRPERFFVSEIIRSKIFQFYKREIPYSTAVMITEFQEEEEIIRIRAEIYVERESQKGIMIGHRGSALKKMGTHARRDLENFFGKKIYLETFIKVSKDWRKKDSQLNKFGYN